MLLNKYYILINFCFRLKKNLKVSIQKVYINNYSVYLYISPKHLVNVMTFLKKDYKTKFTILNDIICLDYPGRLPRFKLIYTLSSVFFNIRLNICVTVDELEGVDSLNHVFSSAC